jgi:lysophospholipase L1-like esterase
VALDNHGFPWVVWSAYDGQDYEIYVSHWNGYTWTGENKITENMTSDSFPSITFVLGTIPFVTWSQTAGRGSAICCTYKTGSDWAPAIMVSACKDCLLNSPKLIAQDSRIGIAWQSDQSIESLLFSFQEIIRGNIMEPLNSVPIPNPALDDTTYLGFGDSITYAEGNGYIPKLEALLVDRFGTATVINEGEGGETTPQGISRFAYVLNATPAKYFLIMEGTNDVIFLEISMDTTVFNLEQMALQSLDHGGFPLLATIIPRNDWRWYNPLYKNRIYDLNDQIRNLSERIKIPLVDQFNIFYNYPERDGGWTSLLLDDLVHPNAKGFQLMAETWFEEIKHLPFAPVDLRTVSSSDDILFYGQPCNIITWKSSPKIFDLSEMSAYKIYRKKEGDPGYALLSVYPNITRAIENKYIDKKVVPSHKYAYLISTLRNDGIEGPCSEMNNITNGGKY